MVLILLFFSSWRACRHFILHIRFCDLRYVDELGRKRGRLMGLGFAASHGGDALEFCAKVGFIKLLTKLWLNRL